MKIIHTLLFLCLCVGDGPLQAASLFFTPQPLVVGPGDVISLTLNFPQLAIPGGCAAGTAALCGTDLAAYQMNLSFDPAVLQATGVFAGSIFAPYGTESFFGGIIDNVSGTITFIANALIPNTPGEGVDTSLASGELFRVEFSSLAEAYPTQVLVSNLLLQSSLDVLNFSNILSDTYVTSGDTADVTVTPEPSLLLPAGIVLLGLAARRKA